ncbi:MAG: PD-(D/E)XK nuclease family protein [Gammaproteobacteria bacterium]|nr:MAG: PD-(D/E)XK nuclease family protein [Gammaproteobacteria bacterium]
MTDLSNTLDRHTTLITVNRRLSRVLRGEFDRAQLAAGAKVWESPDILPYASWLTRCWNDFVAGTDRSLPALLSAEQDLSLWEQVISHRPPADAEQPLLQSAEAARNAQSAWALLRGWRLQPDDDLGFVGEEVRAFRGWARSYCSLCRRGNWVDLASVGDRLVDGLAAVHAAGTRRVLLAGFDALTPQQQSLFTALGELGIRVENRQAPCHDAHALRFDFASRDDELAAAARWARQRIEEGASGTVGIVVPGLAAVRHRVEAIFEDVFAPGAARPGAAEPGHAFNISLGRPLAQVPVVSDALLSLRAMGGQLSLPDAGRWLLSPYLGGGELTWRARLDARLREIGEPRYTLARLGELAGRLDGVRGAGNTDPSAGKGAPFVALLEGLQSRGVAAARQHPVSEWAAQFSSWLVQAGWPGDRPLASDEFQAVAVFRELLGSLAALAPVLPPMELSQALSQLRRLAARQVFQPRSGAAGVQILGVLEAVGVEYAHLWITGLHHQAWPEPARPNPFLPVKLQRELGMPRAGSEQQLRWARAWTARMRASAPEVIVSYPRQQGDEALRPSALVADVPAGEAGALMTSQVLGDAEGVHLAAPTLEVLDDQVAPAVDASRPVRGGVSVFKDQAACPFRAFAIHRLGAGDVAAPDSSLDPRVRGNLAHRLLELLWQALGGQSRLLAMSQEERAQLIRATAGRVLADEARQRPHTLRGRLLAMEQKRLEALADAWLDIEAGRAPFEVEAEHSESSTVAGLPVTLRPDRVDRLDGGELFLVDYKTGRCNPKDWFGERPDEPQLPVYALALDDLGGGQVAGLAFGVLRPGELGYRGLGDGDQVAPGVTSVTSSRLHGARQARDWEAHKSLWRQRLTRLAQAYLEGDARVDPKRPGTTCRYCGLQVLCRIHEQ